jgi:3-oxoacyl-[acyl-carrier-protein] synthase III
VIFLNDIASYVPEQRLGFDVLRKRLDLDDQQVNVFRRYFGLEYVSSAGAMALPELLEAALRQLLDNSACALESIRYIIYCHTNPTVAPHTVNVVNAVKKKLGLGHAVSFGVTQQFCATSIAAFEIADGLLAGEAADAKAVILTGELAFHRAVQIIPDIAVLGEASAACLVGKQGGENRVLAVFQQTVGRQAEGASRSELAREFRAAYTERLIDTVRNAVRMAGLTDHDIALVLPHNVNAVSWKLFGKNYPLEVGRLYLDNVPKLGHCFTSDPFINFTSAASEQKIRRGDHVVMVSVGVDDTAVGATFAAAVIQH